MIKICLKFRHPQFYGDYIKLRESGQWTAGYVNASITDAHDFQSIGNACSFAFQQGERLPVNVVAVEVREVPLTVDELKRVMSYMI